MLRIESIAFSKLQANLSVNRVDRKCSFQSMEKNPLKTRGDRIRWIRQFNRLSQEKFAAELGTSRGAVGNWELDKGIKTENLIAISGRFRVPLSWLADGKGRPISFSEDEFYNPETREFSAPISSDSKNQMAGPTPADIGTDTVRPIQEVVLGPDLIGAKEGPPIAVLGVTVGGSETDEKDRTPDFWMNGETVNYVARPRGLSAAKDVFSVYVRGDSMWPRFEESDLVFLQKTSPAIGDDVVIELYPRREGEESATFIKRLVRRRGSYLTVRQFNPDRELDFDLKEIKTLFRVIPTKEWLG